MASTSSKTASGSRKRVSESKPILRHETLGLSKDVLLDMYY